MDCTATKKREGFQVAEIVVLAFFLVLVVIFILIVLYLYMRMERRQRKSIPKIKINSVDEKSDSQSI
jgi:flagellar biogenesis protein FliO